MTVSGFTANLKDVAIKRLYEELVADDRIRKTINPRDFFQTLAEIQFESGYPYIMYEDTVNRAKPGIAGRISTSNLCPEILVGPTASARYDENLDYADIGRTSPATSGR